MSDFITQGRYRIIMKLEEIPDFTIVTKPTGTKAYEVKRKLPVYADDALKKEMEIKMPDWCIFLCHAGGVDVTYPEQSMAVHFDDFTELMEFVQEVAEEKEIC